MSRRSRPGWLRNELLSKTDDAAADFVDVAAVFLGGAAGGKGVGEREGFALGGDSFAECAAGFAFTIESLGDGGGAAF